MGEADFKTVTTRQSSRNTLNIEREGPATSLYYLLCNQLMTLRRQQELFFMDHFAVSNNLQYSVKVLV